MPQVLRANLAVDQKLPGGFVATLEWIFTKLYLVYLISTWATSSYNALASYENIRPLRVVNAGNATTAPTFRLNAQSIEDFEDVTTLKKSISTSSTWGSLLGIRFIF